MPKTESANSARNRRARPPALGRAGDATGRPSSHRASNDVATGSVLAGQDLAALADASMPETPPPVHDFDIPPDDACFTAAEAARLLGVAKSTVTRRIGKNELIGFRVFKNALRIPRDQFRNGDVVDGVADILALFRIDSPDGETPVDHKTAWTFLASTVYPGDAAPRPIDRLPRRFTRTSDVKGVGRACSGQAESRLRRPHLNAVRVMRIATGEEEEEFEDDGKNPAAKARRAARPAPGSSALRSGRQSPGRQLRSGGPLSPTQRGVFLPQATG